MYCPNHISSVLHLYASVCAAALLANMENRLFSKPFERFTPSQRYPGLMLNLFGGGSGPLYTGFSVKRKKRGAKICKKKNTAEYWLLNLLVQKCKSGELQIKPFLPKHQWAYSPHCSRYIPWGANKDNLSIKGFLFEWVGDHFLYSCGFNILISGEIVRRN